MSNIIAICIKELLAQNGNVYIPTLGQFVLGEYSAKIDASSQSIKPPYQSILFSDAKREDNKLEKALAKKSKLSSDQAKELVLDFSNQISTRLLAKKEAFVAGLGTLRLAKKKISLDQSSSIFNKSGYGLSTLDLTPIDYTLLEKPAHIFNTQDTHLTSGDAEKGKTGWRIFKIFLAALLLFLLLLLVRSCGQYLMSSDNSTNDLKEEVTEQVDNNSIIETQEAEVAPGEVSTKVIPSDEIESNDLAVKSADFIPADGCIIIVGVYKNNRNVIRMQDKLASTGYNVYTEISPEGLTRVGFKFECQDVDLRNYIRAIRKSIHKNSWYLQPQMEVY